MKLKHMYSESFLIIAYFYPHKYRQVAHTIYYQNCIGVFLLHLIGLVHIILAKACIFWRLITFYKFQQCVVVFSRGFISSKPFNLAHFFKWRSIVKESSQHTCNSKICSKRSYTMTCEEYKQQISRFQFITYKIYPEYQQSLIKNGI